MAYEKPQEYINQQNWDKLMGAGEDPGKISQYLNIFVQQYRNATGNDPGINEINAFFRDAGNQASALPGDLNYGDISGLANSYIQNNYQDAINSRGQGQAPGQYNAVSQAFQQTLGRDATQEEKDHFGALLANKTLDSYSLNQWLSQLPENVTKQDAEFRKNLSGDLQKQDAQYYNEQVLPGISQSFAKSGRSFDSSGYAQALAQAAQQQNRQREGFLSNLTAQQYNQNKSNVYDQYLNSVGRTQALDDYNRQRGNALTDASYQHLNQLGDYELQRQAYEGYLKRYGKRNNNGGLGALAGGVAGAGLGSLIGGPAGLLPGYGLGAGFGQSTGSLF